MHDHLQPDTARRLANRQSSSSASRSIPPAPTEATSYPAPGGLSWEGLHELAGVLAERRALAGIDVAYLNGDLDVDGEHARRAASLLEGLLSARSSASMGADRAD